MINRKPYEISLDVNKRSFVSPVTMQQGDRHTNSFNLTMMIDGLPYDVSDTDVSIVYETEDKVISLQTSKDLEKPVTVEENVINFTILNRVLGKVGRVEVQVIVSDSTSGELLASQKFNFEVISSLDIDEAITEEPSFSILVELLAKVDEFLIDYEEIITSEKLRVELYEDMLELRTILEEKIEKVSQLEETVLGLVSLVDELVEINNDSTWARFNRKITKTRKKIGDPK